MELNAKAYWIDRINELQNKINCHEIGENTNSLRIQQMEYAEGCASQFGGDYGDYLPGGRYNAGLTCAVFWRQVETFVVLNCVFLFAF